ncbi:HNH endonuclease [Paraburkholderia silvatlantica]|uniref:HNH endonuclease n=1 Tax=Paraburkholderia silvatlantica TaxID=321895 RepID=UPI00105F1229|nr:HNH endonuclease [Paraburkholderia silvatlantica]TDQ93248.1 HNH endonuclease [Paraburkholderia silvatlantica]
MATWLEDITNALTKAGGIAHYEQLYAEISRIREGALPESWKQIVQRTIQNHSSDSNGYRSGDLFYSVEGIGSGVWGLRSTLNLTPTASDLQELSAPERVHTETYRVLRDTQLARKLKALHKNVCQICGTTLRLADGTTYSEAHHIRPLGAPHDGPDVAGNIIVLCPNHHVLFDYGALTLDADKLSIVHGHYIEEQYVEYHNEIIASSKRAEF